ncbi:MAG: hypothetical protein QOD55_1030, partial [Solirubrobacteraceae bacterium]|nr:hypothetical protein [Solirubrobacteraceae bacterium]
MSSPTRPPDRDERREAARRARLDREGGAAAAGVRRRRLVRLGAVLVVTAVAVVVAIALSGGGGEDAGAPAGSATDRSASERAVRVLAGIPQDGPVLGRASAAVRVVEFADLQCPFCRDVALDGLPQLIQRHVR